MKLSGHYIRLRRQYPHITEHQEFFVTLDELAVQLDCTHRNVQLLLRKMQDEGWLTWTAERGRGRRSRLLFIQNADDMILSAAKELVERKDLRGALAQINVSTLPDTFKDSFHHWLNSYFGHRSEVKGSRRLDTLRFPLAQPLQSLDPATIHYTAEAHLDRVELWHIPDMEKQDRDRTLESFQIIHNYRLADEAEHRWEQVQQQGTTCRFLTFNLLKQGPMNDPELRGLVCSALHRGRLLERLGGDAIFAGDSFIRHRNGLPHDAEPVPYSPEKLRMLVKRSGYAGQPLTLCTITNYERDALHVQALLREAGFAVEINLLTAQEFKSEQRLHADLLLFSIMLDNDAELRIIDLYKSMQRHLEPSVKAHVAKLTDKILREPAAWRRAEWLQAIESHLTARQMLCFLYFKRLKTLYHSSVQGIALDSLDWVQFKNIWFKP